MMSIPSIARQQSVGALRILISPARPPLAALLILCAGAPFTDAAPAADFQGLSTAIRKGNVSMLQRAISKSPATIESRDDQGNTLLHIAAHIGTVDAVRALLRAGAQVNATNHAGVTPLLRAAADPAKVASLLQHGAQPNLASALGHTPLMLAARSPFSGDSVRLLLEKGADPNARSRHGATALMAAAAADHLGHVKLLVEHGANVNAVPAPSDPNTDPIWGGMRTPLMWASLRGNLAMVTYLLDHGAEVNQVVGFGTALSQTGWRQRTEVARLLLDRGANPNQTEPFSGFTPLHWAAAAEETDAGMVRLLLDHGADPKIEGGQPVDAYLGVPQTAWLMAHRRGATAICDVLERAGATPARAEESLLQRWVSSTDGNLDNLGSAVAAAVGPLQKTALFSMNSFVRHASKQDCASCHQQFLPMAATGAARAIGAPIDDPAAKQLISEVRRIHTNAELDAQPLFHPEAAHTYGYALFGLESEKAVTTEVADALVHHLASIQHLDGRWELNLFRPPIQSTPVTSTALGLYALARFGWEARAAEFASRVRLASQWLAEQRPETHEGRVYQLLGLAWSGWKPRPLQAMSEALLAMQRADGGWSQLPGLESDAYATGLSLYALRVAGGLTLENAALRRGAQFLLKTQGQDGTWHVRRRAFPFQPTMDSGFPHGRDSWISATATSWAVMALGALQETPRRRSTPAPALIPVKRRAHQEAAKPSEARPEILPAGPTADFAKDIRPILERSCVECHSGERPRGGYRLTDRESMMAAGSLGTPSVLPGRASESPLLHFVAGQVVDMEMPPVAKRDRYPALQPDEQRLLQSWIDAGAPWPDGVKLGR
ncbi:MAG: ankyrin repeat domain-containing protein [Verrucomicrobiales bacterium]|nr:ankyrin repeat domain-containing protein [Verrucomicrobiales bacterium]